MKIKILIPLALTSLLGACSFAPIGQNNFDCNRQDSPKEYCRSFKAVEKSTNGTLPETRYEKSFEMTDYDKAFNLDAKDGKKTDKPIQQGLPHNYQVSQTAAVDGAPIRQAPILQRIYVKKFVDENDVLHQDQIIYKEVQASKWVGFDMAGAGNYAGGNVYPHKVDGSQPMFVNNAIKNSNSSDGDNSTSDMENSGFSQPNDSSVGSGSAGPSAVNGGNNSMPR